MKKLLVHIYIFLTVGTTFFSLTNPVNAESKLLSNRQRAYITAVKNLRTRYSELDINQLEGSLDLSFWEYLTFREYDITATGISPKDTYYVYEEELLFDEIGEHPVNKIILEEQFYTDLFLYITAVLPPEIMEEINSLHFFSDGQYGTVAATMLTYDSPPNLELSIDIIDIIYCVTNSTNDLYLSTLVHESAHVISLSQDQILNLDSRPQNPYQVSLWGQQEKNNCTTKYLTLGCASSNSYVYTFFLEFWIDNYTDRPEILLTWEEYEEYLVKYPDNFVTPYATSELEEDFAESFMFYVLSSTPSKNQVMCQKLEFFDRYWELKKLRAEFREISILSGESDTKYNICGSTKSQKSLKETSTELSKPREEIAALDMFDLIVASALVVTSAILWIVNFAWFRWVVKR